MAPWMKIVSLARRMPLLGEPEAVYPVISKMMNNRKSNMNLFVFTFTKGGVFLFTERSIIIVWCLMFESEYIEKNNHVTLIFSL